MNQKTGIFIKIIGTLALPMLMFIIMMWASYSNGKMYFGTWAMWKPLIPRIALSITAAYGIGIQFKSGRFDFSGGGIMLIAAIVAGRVAQSYDNNIYIFFGLSLLVCILLSLMVGAIYVFGRLPIVIATIGMALLFESISALIFKGTGVSLIGNMDLKIFSAYPFALIPLILSIIVYGFFNHFTTVGKQSELLANNQQASVNIGINENKVVMITYLYSGILFGLATTIYASSGQLKAAYVSLTTVGSLFSNILPVFISLMLLKFCNDTIGIMMGAITLNIMAYGLTIVFDAEMGAAISIIITGVFILFINVMSAQGSQAIMKIKEVFKQSLKTS